MSDYSFRKDFDIGYDFTKYKVYLSCVQLKPKNSITLLNNAVF